MTNQNGDERASDRQQIDPGLISLELNESTRREPVPPLWKDLMVASAVAVLLWGAAAVVFG